MSRFSAALALHPHQPASTPPSCILLDPRGSGDLGPLLESLSPTQHASFEQRHSRDITLISASPNSGAKLWLSRLYMNNIVSLPRGSFGKSRFSCITAC